MYIFVKWVANKNTNLVMYDVCPSSSFTFGHETQACKDLQKEVMGEILLMEEILHHLGYIKPCK